MEEIVLTAEQELAQLKAAETKRHLLDTAAVALKDADLDTDFAPLLSGADEDDTKERVKIFEQRFSNELQKQIAKRMPNAAPQGFDFTPQSSPRRGIKRR